MYHLSFEELVDYFTKIQDYFSK